MTGRVWGVLHPGAMGASVASCLRAGGASVQWCSAGRGVDTRRRAEDAGLVEARSLADLVEACDALVSVCPPGAARTVAASVAEHGFGGVYLDANAIAPSTAHAVAHTLQSCGGSVVDGGIVGPPAWSTGTTRLFVSGERTPEVAAAFASSDLEVVSVSGGVGAASAVKVAYATWTKAVAAALLTVRAYARAEGVVEPLLDEWARSQPGTVERSELTAAAVGPKAWRFGDELRELGQAMRDAGLPGGFQDAAAAVYDRLAPLEGAQTVDLDRVLDLLDDRREEAGGPA